MTFISCCRSRSAGRIATRSSSVWVRWPGAYSIAMIRKRVRAPPRRRRWPTCSRSQKRSGTTTCTGKIGDTRSSWRRSRQRRLVSAQGRCPPADIGGPMGYETFLKAIADPQHLHHEGMIEWDDPDFDPNRVDEAAIRANLANLGRYLGRRKGEPR